MESSESEYIAHPIYINGQHPTAAVREFFLKKSQNIGVVKRLGCKYQLMGLGGGGQYSRVRVP